MSNLVAKFTTGVIAIVVLFLVLANLMPTAMDAGDDLNATGVPLGSLFVTGGVIFLLIMAGVLYAVMKMFGGK